MQYGLPRVLEAFKTGVGFDYDTWGSELALGLEMGLVGGDCGHVLVAAG